MKRKLALITVIIMLASLIAACGGGSKDNSGSSSDGGSSPSATTSTGGSGGSGGSGGKVTINLWSFTNEVPDMATKFKELFPEYSNVEFNSTVIATTDNAYQPALDQALAAGGSDAPDIYTAEAAFVLKYTQGDMSDFAASYADLGITDQMVQEAGIAEYTIDIGTKDGQLVALGYQATGGALIYRRSIAKDVF